MGTTRFFSDEFGLFCFMRAYKNHITIGFWHGAIMNDSYQLLEEIGIKMRHIKSTL